MNRRILALSLAFCCLVAPTIAHAQSDTMSYGDTMRKHGKISTTALTAKHGAGHAGPKGEKKAHAKKSRRG